MDTNIPTETGVPTVDNAAEISRLENRIKAREYLAAGYLNDKEVQSYMEQAGPDDNKLAKLVRNHGDAYTSGLEQSKVSEDILNKVSPMTGGFTNWLGTLGMSFVRGLSESVTGLADLVIPKAPDLGFGALGEKSKEPLTKLVRESVDTKLFGLPEDPIARAGYFANQPQSAQVVGDIAAFMTTAAMVPETPFKMLDTRLAPTKLMGAFSIGGGLLMAATAPEDTTSLDLVSRVATGIGGGALTASVLLGRGIGNASRATRLAEMFGAMEDSTVGSLLKNAPRITLGKLAHSAVAGASYEVGKNISEGMSVPEAISKGALTGLEWMGYDAAFAGLGSLSRLVPINARISESLTNKLMALGLPAGVSKVAGDVSQFGVNAATGAAIGGMVGGVPGAVVGGGVTGALGAKLQAEMGLAAARMHNGGLLSGETINKMLTGNWTKVSGEEAQQITRALLIDSVLGSSVGEEAIFHKLITEALGHDAMAMEEVNKIRAELGSITKEITDRTFVGVPETHPDIIKLSTRAFEAQERLGQIYDNVTAKFVQGNREITYGANIAAKEAIGIQEQGATDAITAIYERAAKERADIAARGTALDKIAPKSTALSTYVQRGETAMVVRPKETTALAPIDRGLQVLKQDNVGIVNAVNIDTNAIEAIKKLEQEQKGLAARVGNRVIPAVGEVTGRKVGPAGIKDVKRYVTETITPQGVSGIPSTVTDAQAWFANRGLSLTFKHDEALGKTTLVLHGGEGLGEITRGRSLGEIERNLSDIMRTNEAGYIESRLGHALGITAIGAVAGPAFSRWLGLTDENDTNLAAAGLGALAGFAIGIGSLKQIGAKIAPEVEKAVKFVKPHIEDGLTAEAAAKLVGKSDKEFKAEISGKTVSGRRLFWAMPHEQQIEHLTQTLENIPKITSDGKKGIPEETRKNMFEAALTKFTPFSMTEQDFDKVAEVFMRSAKAVGYSTEKANTLFTGMLGWMTYPLTERARLSRRPLNLFDLGTSIKNPFTTAAGMAELRDKVLMGEIIAGSPTPLPAGYNAAAKKVINQAAPPANSAVAALKKAMDEIETGDVQGFTDRIIPAFGAGLRPNVSFLRYGERILAGGDPVGQKILDATRGVFTVASEIRRMDEADRLTIAKMFQGITSKTDHELVRQAVEDPVVLAGLRGKNDVVYESAVAVRKFLDDRATTLGLLPGQKIENYFPWVYNANTLKEIREMAQQKRIPQVMWDPSTNLPSHVFFAHFEPRKLDTPMGERVNPMTSLMLYAHGANRKLMMDQLLTNVTSDTLKDIAKSQPWIAKDLGRWILDVAGVPSSQAMWASAKLRQLGVALEKFPMFSETAFGQDVLERYFNSGANADNVARALTYWAYTSKITWSLTSAMVNASQFITNGGTDLGILTIFASVPAGLALATGEKVPVLAPVIDANVKNVGQYRKMLHEHGLFGRSDQVFFDEMARHEALYGEGSAHAAFTGAVTGATVGAFGTAVYNKATGEDHSVAAGAALAATGAGIAAAQSALARRILTHVRDYGSFPFDLAETMNRSVVGVAGYKEAVAAEKAAASPTYAALRNAREIVDHSVVGAIGGAGAGYTMGDQGDKGQTALVGAAVGAGLYGGLRATAGASTYERVQRGRQAIADSKLVFNSRIFKDQKEAALKPYTSQEINELYAAMQNDITQFRMGREGRGWLMNTPQGQAIGALQSFTLNQADFVGGRMHDFMTSFTKASKGEPAQIDFRVMRYAAFVMGTGAAYSALMGGFGDERDPQYWMSRVGFGLFPWLRYDPNAKHWTVADPGSVFNGPITSDIQFAANNFLTLWTDENARRTFPDVADDVANHLFIGARNMEDQNNTVTGKQTKALYKEGLFSRGK